MSGSHPPLDGQAESSSEYQQEQTHAQLRQRRQLLKAAALAAPLLVTLRARSVYAQTGMDSTGLAYGTYARDANNIDTTVHEPGAQQKKKKKFFYWW